jgi:hypothetical protein
MCSPINAEKVGLVDFGAGESLPSIACLADRFLEGCEADYIESLQDMGGVRWIAEDDNHIITSIDEESERVMGVVAVQDKRSPSTLRFFARFFVEILQPGKANFAGGPTLL